MYKGDAHGRYGLERSALDGNHAEAGGFREVRGFSSSRWAMSVSLVRLIAYVATRSVSVIVVSFAGPPLA